MHERLETIFNGAIGQISEAEQAAYLDGACHGDTDLRHQVEQLLADYKEGEFLEKRLAPDMPVTTLSSEPAPLVHSMIGPYKLLQVIGEGGMGTVYMADQRKPVERRVAIKIIKAGMDSKQVIARFAAEQQALALMDHPNIAKVLDAGTTETGRPYFVMELVKGIPITKYCDEKQLTLRERLGLIVDVCNAIQHAHQKGIIHRDIKPSNVLVTQYDGKPVPKVIDFGVAKATAQRLTEKTMFTEFGAVIGTLEYMSPEQAELNQLDVDTRSDVYSIGVLFYELLTGSTPLDGTKLRSAAFNEMLRMIREDEPQKPSTKISSSQALPSIAACRQIEPLRLTKQVRGELDWIAMKALDKDRGRRYSSANAFAEDINRYLANEPVLAFPPSMAYRFTKMIRRYKVAAVAAVVVTTAILSSLVFSTVKYLDERQARREADSHQLIAEQNAVSAKNSAAQANIDREEALRQKSEAQSQRKTAQQNLYFADVRLASVDLEVGNLDHASKLLMSHVPFDTGTDLRGWEWYYLLSQCHQAEQELFGHKKEVTGISWSPDGDLLASVSHDGSARIWNARTWQLVREFNEGGTIKCCVDWSPDGKKLAWGSASNESALRVWDRETDSLITMHGAVGSIWEVDWATEALIATASLPFEEGRPNIYLWNTEKQKISDSFTSDGGDPTSIEFSPSGGLFAFTNGTEAGSVFRAQDSQFSLGEVTGKPMNAATWNPKSLALAIGTKEGEFLLWNFDRKEVLAQWKGGHSDVADLKWNSEGSLIAAAYFNGNVEIWRDGKLTRSIAANKGKTRISWDPAGNRLATCGIDPVIRIWNLDPTQNPVRIESNLKEASSAWDRNSKSIFRADPRSGTILRYDAASGAQISDNGLGPSLTELVQPSRNNFITEYRNENLLNGVLSPKLDRVASISVGLECVMIRSVVSEGVVQSPNMTGLCGISWSPDGKQLAVVGQGRDKVGGLLKFAGWVYIVDPDSGAIQHRFQISGDRVQATAVAWNHDGKKIAVGNLSGQCEVWDVQTETLIFSEQVHLSQVADLTWSQDDRRVASGGRDGVIHIWDPTNGKSFLTLGPHDAPIRELEWSPDGRKLAVSDKNGVVLIWDATKGFDLEKGSSRRHLTEPQQWSEFDRLTMQGRWSEASQVLNAIVEQGNREAWALFQLALVQLQMDDQAGYQNSCKRMLETPMNVVHGLDPFYSAFAATVISGSLADFGPAVESAQLAAKIKTNSRSESCQSAIHFEILGASFFRSGNFEEATHALLNASLTSLVYPNPSDLKGSYRTDYFLAMTLHRLGKIELSKKWFARANQQYVAIEEDIGKPSLWRSKLMIELVRKEASELLKLPTNYGLDDGVVSDDKKQWLSMLRELRSNIANSEAYRVSASQGSKVRTEAYRVSASQGSMVRAEVERLAGQAATTEAELDDADFWLNEAVQSEPNSPEFWKYVGEHNYEAGRFQAAIDAMTKCLELVSANSDLYYPDENFWLAKAYVKLGQTEKAVDLLLAAIGEKTGPKINSMIIAEAALLDGVLEELSKRALDDGLFQAELARYYAQQGQATLAQTTRVNALARFKEKLAKDPENSALAVKLADLLLTLEQAWTVLTPVEMKSETGAKMELQTDVSIFVHQQVPSKNDTYSVVFQSELKGINSLRLEALTTSRFPIRGPGWAADGNFVLNEVTLEAASAENPDQTRAIVLRNASADFSQEGWDVRGTIDGVGSSGWAVAPQTNEDHTAVFELSENVGDGQPMQLIVRLNHQHKDPSYKLSCFRVSVANDPSVFDLEQKRFAAMKLSDPWAKLGAAYVLTGDTDRAADLFAQTLKKSDITSGIGSEWLTDRVLESLRTRHPEPYVAYLQGQASAAAERGGQIDQARSLYEQLVKLQPDNALWKERLEQLKPDVIAVWNFDSSLKQWTDFHNCELAVKDGTLTVRTTGDDPHFGTPALGPAGEKALVMRYRSAEAFTLELRWAESSGGIDETRVVRQPIPAAIGEWQEVIIPFSCQEALISLRLDPKTTAEHPIEIDSLVLQQLESR